MNFEFHQTTIEGLQLIHPFLAEDSRGFLLKCYEQAIFQKNGIFLSPYEELTSQSQKGTLRGLHFQTKFSQDKLVRVLQGEVFDVAVDLRKNSATFGKWEGFFLSDKNHSMLYIPKGFAHGFLALSETVLFSYLCGNQYHPQSDGGIRWDDPTIGIQWPFNLVDSIVISEKDKKLPTFSEYIKQHGGFAEDEM